MEKIEQTLNEICKEIPAQIAADIQRVTKLDQLNQSKPSPLQKQVTSFRMCGRAEKGIRRSVEGVLFEAAQ